MDIVEKRKIILGARDWVATNLPISLKIQNNSYCKMLILSTIDCFAQMWGNYPLHGGNRVFCNFIIKFSKHNDTFKKVCPVTLHYHYAKECPLELQKGHIYMWDDPILVKESDKLLITIKDDERRNTAMYKHSYIQLLYRLRSQLVHELNNLGTKIEFNHEIPSIASGLDEYGKTIWSLNFPRLWLYELAKEVIYNFIDECLKNDELLCFLDNPRKVNLTWYE